MVHCPPQKYCELSERRVPRHGQAALLLCTATHTPTKPLARHAMAKTARAFLLPTGPYSVERLPSPRTSTNQPWSGMKDKINSISVALVAVNDFHDQLSSLRPSWLKPQVLTTASELSHGAVLVPYQPQ
jgi:hypothetical protein